MSNARTKYGIDAFMVQGYDVPDAMPADVVGSESQQTPVIEYKVPLVVWMLIFLIVGYVGLRYFVEE